MRELLDKQVYVLNECFKCKFRDSRWGSKVCDKNVRKKNDSRVKIILMTGRTMYMAVAEVRADRSQ